MLLFEVKGEGQGFGALAGAILAAADPLQKRQLLSLLFVPCLQSLNLTQQA